MADWVDALADLAIGGRCVVCARPGRSLCHPCGAALPWEGVEVSPTPRPDGLASCRAAGPYADALRSLIVAHKEHAVLALSAPLGELLALAAAPWCTGPTLLAPVPSRSISTLRRGHDPTWRMTKHAARLLRAEGAEVRAVPLLRLRLPVTDQSGLDSAARAANLADALALRPGQRRRLVAQQRPAAVVICDDVLTTGATAREAQHALEAHGFAVRGVATVAATRRRGARPELAAPGADAENDRRSPRFPTESWSGALTSLHGVRDGSRSR